jgi:hypothetical protein
MNIRNDNLFLRIGIRIESASQFSMVLDVNLTPTPNLAHDGKCSLSDYCCLIIRHRLRPSKGTIAHVQQAFLRPWLSEPRETPYPKFVELHPLMNWARAHCGEAVTHLETMTDEEPANPMLLPWAVMVKRQLGRAPAMTTIGEAALQVALHSTYHRGRLWGNTEILSGCTNLDPILTRFPRFFTIVNKSPFYILGTSDLINISGGKYLC